MTLGIGVTVGGSSSGAAAEEDRFRLVTADGFGNPNNIGVGRVHAAQGYLFAGTWNDAEGMIVYRSRDGEHFERISAPGITGNPLNFVSQSFIWFNGMLYASSWNDAEGGAVFRANAAAEDSDDIVWETVTTGGFGNPENSGIHMNLVFEGHLYIGTFNFAEGSEVWRSDTGDSGDWVQVNQPGYGDPRCNVDSANMIEHDGYLYVGVETAGCFFARPPRSGTRVLRTDGDLSPPYDQWEQVNLDGYGNDDNHNTIGLALFEGHMYAATWNVFDGTEVWRAKIGPGQTDTVPFEWEKVNENGFGSPMLNQNTNYVLPHGSSLYLLGYAQSGPGQGFFYKSDDGTTWEEITGPDWPPPRGPGSGPYWATVFRGKIYVAVHRGNGPAQLWVYIGCESTLTGRHTGPVVVSGTTCIDDAKITGPLTVRPGASVYVTGESTVRGPLTASGAERVVVQDSSVNGPVSIVGTTGEVAIERTKVSGPVVLVNNTPDIGAPVVSASTVGGPLVCTGNVPAPTDRDQPNTVHGPSTGQCAGM